MDEHQNPDMTQVAIAVERSAEAILAKMSQMVERLDQILNTLEEIKSQN
jgi:hypothetical protein